MSGAAVFPEVDIEDHGVIGDCRSTALVSAAGTIDFLCWPRPDSNPLFAALLDGEQGGGWSIAPRGQTALGRQEYVPGTNVLTTTFSTPTGELRVTDLMPLGEPDGSGSRRTLEPDHELLRLVECTRGTVEVETRFAPRPHFAAALPRFHRLPGNVMRAECASSVVLLRCDEHLELLDEGATLVGRRTLRAGDELHFSLSYTQQAPAVIPLLGAHSHARLLATIGWWRRWLGTMRYAGPFRDEVERSALALKLMCYAPSGAIVAAATTSLPERVGGALNWDYRYCWLRDAALSARALYGLGFDAEAESCVGWLVHTTRLTLPRLHTLYDVFGNQPGRERLLDGLSGYRGSRPVRVGNAAVDQLQLDVYGELLDAVAHFTRRGGDFDADTQRMLVSLGEFVERHWEEPDEGIWEPRDGRARHTHSLLLCWTAMDRLVELERGGKLRRVRKIGEKVRRFAAVRERIRQAIETRAFSAAIGSYVAALDAAPDDAGAFDASLLLLSWYGYTPASSSRMRGTYDAIRRHLDAGGGLLYRYRGDTSPGEGAFGVCGFWAAEHLALGGGTLDEAVALFEQLLGYANPVGLFAEEIDPRSGRAVGNFPQAFTHLGVINAALSIEDRMRRERGDRDGVAEEARAAVSATETPSASKGAMT